MGSSCVLEKGKRDHNMSNIDYVKNLVQKYHPQIPIEELIVEINKIYHKFEASMYDRNHPEIYEQLPSIWKEMCEKISSYLQAKALHILDFGCGTGFASQQLLRNISPTDI